ncbi:hypothetical protein MBTS_04785 [Methylobacterium bullatum]|nr:hypothetical protein [Methylobacterium bullatum]
MAKRGDRCEPYALRSCLIGFLSEYSCRRRSSAKGDRPSRPPHPEVPFAGAKGLEGALQKPKRSLEGSFEAAARHLRMR